MRSASSTENGDLICQCTAGMPVFVADVMRAAVQDGLELYGPDDLNQGDIIVTNYAGTIGQHLNNVTMYTPIHAGRSGLVGFMVVVMHWIDVGGRDIGSTSKFATDIFQEGIQFRTVKLRARGEPVREIYRMIEHNTRFPVEMMGDINSQIGGCLMGRDSVIELVERYGDAVFRAAIDTIWRQSEAEARAAIRAIPDGTYTAEATLDDDGLNPGSLHCKVVVTVAGDEMTIDLSQLPGEVRAPMNSGYSGGGSTVARLAFRYLLLPEGDASEGTFRPLKLVLPEGTIVSARPTAPMGSYNSALPTLIDLVIRAIGQAVPDRVAAAHYGTFSTLAFAGRASGVRHPLAVPRQRLRRLGRALRHGRAGTVSDGVSRRHPNDPDRGARGDLSVHDRELQPAHGFRRTRAFPRRPWARTALPDAGARPHLDPDRTDALPGLGI